MKSRIIFLMLVFVLNSCGYNSSNIVNVKNSEELQKAIKSAQPGDEIILANGVWKDINIEFDAEGTKNNRIILRAEEKGKVFIEGKSSLKFGGDYLTVSGLYFRNGYTPSRTIIDFHSNKNEVSNYCRVTECVIEEFTKPNRNTKDHWVEFWGRHNSLDHCYISGKSNQGPTVRVYLSGNENIRNYHQIVNNHFGPRPRHGGPKSETMQIGDSYTSMTPSYINVSNNFFEKCNGEVEIISSKSNFNEFRNNVFFESEGSLVLRHGNYCVIDGNFFIGNDNSNFIGGIRVINTGHWITNNYFYKVNGDEFRGPLAIMNGIPKSPLNRYNQVTDVVVAYNSWIDCKSPWQFSVGANSNKSDVLPPQEIRSARPKRVLVANNVIYNSVEDKSPTVEYDKVDGIKFKNNIIDNQESGFDKYDGVKEAKLSFEEITEYLFVPTENEIKILSNTYDGYDFDQIKKDIFGKSRSRNNKIGAIANLDLNGKLVIDKKLYGPSWFVVEKSLVVPTSFTIEPRGESLGEAISKAMDGDILELSPGKYSLDKSLVINKKLTIKSKHKSSPVRLVYDGNKETALFEMNPDGSLILENIILEGNSNNCAFITLKEKMSSAYNLSINNSIITGFGSIIKSYKASFADSISFKSVKFANCNSGIVLAAEVDDKGDYNAEYLIIENCKFKNIKKDVINFYRGGYDESTIGGVLLVKNSIFENCGGGDASNLLIKNRGIINVNLVGNSFINNPVKVISQLWGEKNNIHSENLIKNSGKIVTEQYLKQKLVY